jgi:cytoskeletal protein RodZ
VENLESIGEILKKRRGEKGLTLANAYESTKITMQNLAALEEDRFDAFPNRVYARAFLRDYANFLGVDSDELLQRYETEWGTPVVAPVVRRRWPKVIASIGIILILGGASGTGYYYMSKAHKAQRTYAEQSKPKPEPKPQPETSTTSSAGAPAVNSPTGTQPKTTTTETTTPPKPAGPPIPGKVKVLARAVNEPVWVEVKADGKLIYADIIAPPNGSVTAVGKDVKVKTAKANCLDMTIDDKHIGAFGPPNKLVKQAYTAQPAISAPKPVAPTP